MHVTAINERGPLPKLFFRRFSSVFLRVLTAWRLHQAVRGQGRRRPNRVSASRTWSSTVLAFATWVGVPILATQASNSLRRINTRPPTL